MRQGTVEAGEEDGRQWQQETVASSLLIPEWGRKGDDFKEAAQVFSSCCLWNLGTSLHPQLYPEISLIKMEIEGGWVGQKRVEGRMNTIKICCKQLSKEIIKYYF